jgi:hypothetical protein
MEEKIDVLRNELEIRDEELGDLEKAYKEQVKKLKNSGNDAPSLSKTTRRTIDEKPGMEGGFKGSEVKQYIDVMLRQVREKEIENLKLKMINEHERQVRELEKSYQEGLIISK